MVTIRAISAIGMPFEAIIAAVCSKPPILPQPDLRKSTASRIRPTSAAASATLGDTTEFRDWFMPRLARVFMGSFLSGQVEEQDFGPAGLVQGEFGFVREL